MKHLKVSNNEKTVTNNLTDNCLKCYQQCDFQGKVIENCPEYGGRRRQGKRVVQNCKAFLCCDKTKTTKLFRDTLEALTYAFPYLTIPIEEIRLSEQKKVNRLVHNLTSLNAHNIQEIYDLIPQEILAQNWRKQVDFIKDEIAQNPDKAALMFLRIAKHNTHMKSEFSIYKKIEREDNTSVEKREHNLRNALLNTLHTFFVDFKERGVYVDVKEFYYKLYFDYETIQVAFYHLLDNASKYTLPDSKITISATEDENHVALHFEMTSTYVAQEEQSEIMKEGVSGEMAKKLNRHGDGIGMWRINQMIEINDGEFAAEFGSSKIHKMGFDFSNNVFIIKFDKR